MLPAARTQDQLRVGVDAPHRGCHHFPPATLAQHLGRRRASTCVMAR